MIPVRSGWHLSMFAFRKRQQCSFSCMVAVAEATHILGTELAMLHQDNAIYVVAVENKHEKLG